MCAEPLTLCLECDEAIVFRFLPLEPEGLSCLWSGSPTPLAGQALSLYLSSVI